MPTSSLSLFKLQARVVRRVVAMNLDGVTHEDSIVAPTPAGNSINWVVGHLLFTYNSLLPLLNAEAVADGAMLDVYARGAETMTDFGLAIRLDELCALWETAAHRITAALDAFDPLRLDDKAAVSPTGNPDETMGSLIAFILFHQAYHAGQLGLLRRLLAKPRAIP